MSFFMGLNQPFDRYQQRSLFLPWFRFSSAMSSGATSTLIGLVGGISDQYRFPLPHRQRLVSVIRSASATAGGDRLRHFHPLPSPSCYWPIPGAPFVGVRFGDRVGKGIRTSSAGCLDCGFRRRPKTADAALVLAPCDGYLRRRYRPDYRRCDCLHDPRR